MPNKKLIASSAVIVLIAIAILPSYAEVTSLKTDKTLYIKGDDKTMTFTGTASSGDYGEIVTIVTYDPSDNFVKPAHSGFVSSDGTFEINIPEKDFADITYHGTYTATAFIQKVTDGITITFDYSTTGSPVNPTQTTTSPPSQTSSSSPSSSTSSSSSSQSSSQSSSDSGKSIQDKIQERIDAAKQDQSSSSDTTSDPAKSIEDKIKERIEAAKNDQSQTTGTTDSTGQPKSTNENVDTTTGDSKQLDNINTDTPPSTDPIILYVAIGVGVAAAAGLAFYGLRFKPKLLTKQVEGNSTLTQFTDPTEEDYSLMILKNRLAKGEISIDEFNRLKNALKD